MFDAGARVHPESAEGQRGAQQTEPAVPQADWAGRAVLQTGTEAAQQHTPWCGERTHTCEEKVCSFNPRIV